MENIFKIQTSMGKWIKDMGYFTGNEIQVAHKLMQAVQLC